MDEKDIAGITQAHSRLVDDLSGIKPYSSKDVDVVLRDRIEHTLLALMHYLAATLPSDDTSVHMLHTLILALHDVDNGQSNKLFKPVKARGGRPANAIVHQRRAIVLASVKHLKERGGAKNDSSALKLLSEISGVSLNTLKSNLSKAIHEPNPDVLDPERCQIPKDADLVKLGIHIARIFSPKP